jgi:hypothetical protein
VGTDEGELCRLSGDRALCDEVRQFAQFLSAILWDLVKLGKCVGDE